LIERPGKLGRSMLRPLHQWRLRHANDRSVQTNMTKVTKREPWLRGTLGDIPAVHRAALHAFELAEEDITRWCEGLRVEEWNARPGGVACVAFHLRHIARSADRLLTYAEGRALSEKQMTELKTEKGVCISTEEELTELRSALEKAASRVRVLVGEDLEAPRTVGRELLPASLGGLLVHVAEHTQRHVGQAITTAKVVRAARRT
jgi:uncharacterized damage-inducible protein DinB